MSNATAPTIAVAIPCYQEALTIGKVVADFRRELPGARIYVYDNNCTDGTAEIAAKAGATVIREKRQGKGFVVAMTLTRPATFTSCWNPSCAATQT
jgi:glycosyltransferase involved in cell wall biosynthesis